MNKLAKSLLIGLLEDESKVIAFYGGGFKPPTKGHFEVVKKTLQDYPEITKFYIVIGSGVRNGITQKESKTIWEIYKPYLSDKIEVVEKKEPLKYISNFSKENPDVKTYAVVGTREGDEDDAKDFIQRKEFFSIYGDNIEVLQITTGGGVSGTKTRKSAGKSKEEFFKYLPTEITSEEREEIYNIVFPVLTEIQIVDKLVDKAKAKWKDFKEKIGQEKKETKEAYELIKRKFKGETLTQEEENKIKEQSKDLLRLLGLGTITALPGGTLILLLLKLLKQDKLVTPSAFKEKPITETHSAQENFDYAPYLKSLVSYMIDQGLEIQPLPKVKFITRDVKNASDFFGKTAYYNPDEQTVTLYTYGRLPKDVLRSFAHEMIHHKQKLEGKIGGGVIKTTNIHDDPYLEEMEKEAFLTGNMMFRGWSDSENPNKIDITLHENVEEPNRHGVDFDESLLGRVKDML